MKINFLIIFSAFALFQSCSNTPEKKEVKEVRQEIPAKREFAVNTSVNPCQDYHQYVCSKVESEFVLPSDRSNYTFSFSDSAERILNFKKDYFKKLGSITPENDKEKMLKNYYVACMDEKAGIDDEKSYVVRLTDELKNITSRQEMQAYLGRKILSTETGFIDFGRMSNQADSSYYDLYLVPTLMSLPERTYYEKADLEKEYKEVISLMFKSIGRANGDEIANKIFSFEKSFSKVFPTPLEFREITVSKKKTTKKALLKNNPNLDLKEFLSQIPDKTLIRDLTPASMDFVNKKLSELSLDELKDLFLFTNLRQVLDDAYPEYHKKKFAFDAKFLGGPEKRPDRQERCTRATMDSFSMELDYILVPRMFPNFPREKFVTQAEEIRSSLIDSLVKNTWLSKKGKAGAIAKIKNAKLHLVTPQTDDQWNFVPYAEYSDKKPMENYFKLRLLQSKKIMGEFGKKVPNDRWGMGPLTVNAYYNASYNHFVLPIAILQYPFFDANSSREQNLAAIGTIIGHELGHAIDDQGRKFDDKGRLRDWVTKSDIKGLSKRTAPLINQFNAIGHNGGLTLGENIGDLVGVSTSFKAAFPDYKIGKYNKDDLQKYFLQYARVWCTVQTEAMKERRLKTDPHSAGFARINEQVKQQPAFKEAYSCKDSDKMVLDNDKLVRIW